MKTTTTARIAGAVAALLVLGAVVALSLRPGETAVRSSVPALLPEPVNVIVNAWALGLSLIHI